jgi:hypothetical protein
MAKIFQIRQTQQPATRILPKCWEREETAAQLVAIMQAKFSHPSSQEMLEILRCTEQQISSMQS